MEQFYKGKIAIVTGASSGLGRELAVELANLGAKVVLAARREAPLHELAAEGESGDGSLTLPNSL